jgi:dihydrofolate synthase/folylpolyglutamate synthase
MPQKSLDDWLKSIESLHPREIDLRLERVQEVLYRLGMQELSFPVVTVGGTNGKGSVVELVQNALGHAGFRVAAYTSPHLVRFNERMRVDGIPLTDEQILSAIDTVEQARGEVPLTYFEFTTLSALVAFTRCKVQVAVLEIGLGGRLDAVNAVDPLVAVVTSVDMDHVDWLGNTREAIGREKAGIFRPDRPAIVGDPDPPESVLARAAEIHARLACIGRDFGILPAGEELEFWNRDGVSLRVPRTDLTGDLDGQNTAIALQALLSLPDAFVPSPLSLRESFGKARIAGRFQRHVETHSGITWVLDVAHNVAAVSNLVNKLRREPGVKRWSAVLGMLRDKDASESLAMLEQQVQCWYLAPLPGSRGQSAAELAAKIRGVVTAPVNPCESIAQAISMAREQSRPGDGVLVLGSFQLVGPAMELLRLYSQSDH